MQLILINTSHEFEQAELFKVLSRIYQEKINRTIPSQQSATGDLHHKYFKFFRKSISNLLKICTNHTFF